MKFAIVLLLVAFTFPVVGFSTTPESGSDQGAVPDLSQESQYSAPPAYARCGLAVYLSAGVIGDTLTVTADGEPGPECYWIRLEVEVKMRQAGTQTWITQTGYIGPGDYWANSFNITGYDRFYAKAKSVDTPDGPMPSICSDHGSSCLSTNHRVYTTLEENL